MEEAAGMGIREMRFAQKNMMDSQHAAQVAVRFGDQPSA
jgi:hypothetical protein